MGAGTCTRWLERGPAPWVSLFRCWLAPLGARVCVLLKRTVPGVALPVPSRPSCRRNIVSNDYLKFLSKNPKTPDDLSQEQAKQKGYEDFRRYS